MMCTDLERSREACYIYESYEILAEFGCQFEVIMVLTIAAKCPGMVGTVLEF